jgi:hypothetical protein
MDEKGKRQLEKDLSNLTFSEMKNAFKHLSAKQFNDLEDVMYDIIIGRKLCHEWCHVDTSKYVMYDGRVENQMKDNSV